MRVIVAAAGTAGHINPGLAIANKIKQVDRDSKIIFIGTTRGLENDLVPRSGYELKTIEAYGLSKKLSLDNFKKIYKTFLGYGQAKKIIREFKPDIVIGTGGYICGATILAAHNLGVPTLLHESNAFPGRAVKMLAKKVDTILISFKEAKERIGNAKNIVFTGTPVKISKRVYDVNQKLDIVKSSGLVATKPIVLVFGGSQGAQRINDAIVGIVKDKLNKSYQIIWATGPKQYDVVKQMLQHCDININNIENTKIVPYIYNMEEIMNVSNLIVARSGAMTITEISNLAKPSILIPLPNVSNDHQLYNAKVLEDVGAAKIILNDVLDAEGLNLCIEDIVLNKDRELEMSRCASEVATFDVEDKIFGEIDRLVKDRSWSR